MTDVGKDPKKVAAAHARSSSLSPADRSNIARQAALTRHRKDLPKAIAEGVLQIGGVRLSCAVLDDADNTRVLTQNGFLQAMGRHPFAAGGSGSAIDNTPPFLKANNLKPFVSSDLERSMKPLIYLPRNPMAGAQGVGYGYRGKLLPDVCWVYTDAMAAKKLHKSQLHIGESCRNFLKALTNYAIDDLIDQATGYDNLRKREAINRMIEKYVRQDALPWVRMFDLDFYRYIYRLNSWPFDPDKTARPGVIGTWTNDIYDRMAPGIRGELHTRVRRNEKGKPTQKLTQYLTKEDGRLELKELLGSIKMLMKLSVDWKDFMHKLDIYHPKFGNTLQLPFDEKPKQIT